MKRIAKYSPLLKLLVFLEVFVGIVAMIGGTEIVTKPLEEMNLIIATKTAYLVPGILLITLVGGVNLLASIFILKKKEYSLELSAVAGFDLQVWIVTQMFVVKQVDWRHAFYFTLGTFILLLTFWIGGLLNKNTARK